MMNKTLAFYYFSELLVHCGFLVMVFGDGIFDVVYLLAILCCFVSYWETDRAFLVMVFGDGIFLCL